MSEAPELTLAGFFDDAAVFPPGSSQLDAAVLNHLARRETPIGSLTGPLLLGLDQVHQARRLALSSAAMLGFNLAVNPLDVGVIIPAGGLAVARRTAHEVSDVVHIATMELKATSDSWRTDVVALGKTDTAALRYIELTAEMVDAGALDLLAGEDVHLKFRTGGLEAPHFPTPLELATVVSAAAARAVPFKLTAGLHQAVRHTNPSTGFTHHGFLNIALATAAALAGEDMTGIRAILEKDDAAWISAKATGLGETAWRSLFRSFGTCSIAEPLNSLAALGIDPLAWGTESPAEDTAELRRSHA